MTVDPGGRRAATALLEAAARLGPAPELERLRRRRRRRAASRVGLAVAAVVVAGALAGRVLPGLERVAPGPADPSAAPATTLARPAAAGLDPHVREVIDTGPAERAEVAAGASGVWVLNRRAGQPGELVRVDPDRGQVVARIGVGDNVARPFVAPDGLVWLTRAGPRADRPELVAVNPSTNRVAVNVPLPGADLRSGGRALLVTGTELWVADDAGRLWWAALPITRVEPVRGADDAGRLADAGGWVWATSGGVGLQRVDQVDGEVVATVTGPALRQAAPATAVVGAQESLWLAGRGGPGARLLRLDPFSGQPQALVRLGAGADGPRPELAAGERVLAARVGADLFLVDPATSSVRATVRLGADRGGVAASAGTVWATDPARGRLLRVDPGF
jgi:hypothetical protein